MKLEKKLLDKKLKMRKNITIQNVVFTPSKKNGIYNREIEKEEISINNVVSKITENLKNIEENVDKRVEINVEKNVENKNNAIITKLPYSNYIDFQIILTEEDFTVLEKRKEAQNRVLQYNQMSSPPAPVISPSAKNEKKLKNKVNSTRKSA